MNKHIIFFLGFFLYLFGCNENDRVLRVSISELEGVRSELEGARSIILVRTNSSFGGRFILEDVPEQLKKFLQFSDFEKSKIDLEITEKWIASLISENNFNRIGIKVRRSKVISSQLSLDPEKREDPFE